MRWVALTLVVAITGAACSNGDAVDDETAPPSPTSSTTMAPDTTQVTTTVAETTTTTTPPTTSSVPSGDLIRGGLTPAVIVGGEIVVNRTDGSQTLDLPWCGRAEGTITAVALVVACDQDGTPSFVSVDLRDGSTSVRATGGAAVVAAGDTWVLTCADGATECPILDALTLEPLATNRAIAGPGSSGELQSGLDDLLAVGRGDDRRLYRIANGTASVVRAGANDDTWGRLVRLGDGRTAMAIRISTGGDSRPEEIAYVDPESGDLLDYADGAERNTLYGVGPDVIRATVDVNVQAANVRGFAADGTELWEWPDPDVRAVGHADRVWIYTPGRGDAVMVDPLTGEETGFLRFPGHVDTSFGAVTMIDGWILAHVDTDVGAQVVALSY